jgi:hypothetical protein
MVVLDLGTERVTVPEICVEIRTEGVGTEGVAATEQLVPRRRWRKLALAVTVPLGLIAVATVGLLASDPR